MGIIVNTPAQVHFYRHIYERLIQHGHEAFLIARREKETLDLLQDFRLPYDAYSEPPGLKIGKILSLPKDVIKATTILKKHRVDIITGFGVYDAYSSALLGVPNVVFTDSELKIGIRSHELQFNLFLPFVDCLITPLYYREDLGKKHIRINGMKEIAYLHPNEFRPDESIFDALGIGRGERYSLLRFNGLTAFHDLGVGGFSTDDKVQLVHELEKYGHVFISSEKGVPREIGDRVSKLPKDRIHDLEYFASLLVTDTQTMATEAAILGTPTVRCNSFVGDNDMGNFIELEKRYRLLFNYGNSGEAMAKAIELTEDGRSKAEWGRRREALMRDMIDVTSLMTWFLESHPDSMNELRDNPEIQNMFRRIPQG